MGTIEYYALLTHPHRHTTPHARGACNNYASVIGHLNVGVYTFPTTRGVTPRATTPQQHTPRLAFDMATIAKRKRCTYYIRYVCVSAVDDAV